jgi:hypothetical protein
MASRDNQSKQNSGNAQKGGQQQKKQNQQQAQKKPQQTQQTKTTAAPQRTKKQTADDVLRQKVRQIQNVVPGWTTEDVIRILKDSNGSPEVAIEKMITGTLDTICENVRDLLLSTHIRDAPRLLVGEAGHPSEDWQPAKKKKAEKSVKVRLATRIFVMPYDLSHWRLPFLLSRRRLRPALAPATRVVLVALMVHSRSNAEIALPFSILKRMPPPRSTENGGQRSGGAGRPDAGRGGRYPDSKPSGGAPGTHPTKHPFQHFNRLINLFYAARLGWFWT